MDYLSSIREAIQKASEAYVETLSAIGKTIEGMSKRPGETGGESTVEHWLLMARMSKDGLITALEQGFEVWERNCRQMMAAAKSGAGREQAANPFEAWAENWRKAAESFTASGTWPEEARKQMEAVQKKLQESVAAWQRLWTQNK